MPQFTSHPAGTFCWLELATTDRVAGRDFYAALFDWTVREFPIGPDEMFMIFSKGESSVAAGHQLGPELLARQVPPHWDVYICVSDVNATTARVSELGGTVVGEPFDVMDVGRMSVCQDPTGAHFNLWEPRRLKGMGIKNEEGALCWVDLNSTDSQRAAEFYKALLGWDAEVGDSPYIHFKIGGEYIGGSMPGALQPGLPSHWMPYIMVADADATAAKSASLGGRAVFGPTTMENVGRIAVLKDPQGAHIAIFQNTGAHSG
jgi:hypothetical protein